MLGLALSDISKKSTLLEEILSYLKESLDENYIRENFSGILIVDDNNNNNNNIKTKNTTKKNTSSSSNNNDKAREDFLSVLNSHQLYYDLVRRVKDLKKNMEGIRHELQSLREMTDVIREGKRAL